TAPRDASGKGPAARGRALPPRVRRFAASVAGTRVLRPDPSPPAAGAAAALHIVLEPAQVPLDPPVDHPQGVRALLQGAGGLDVHRQLHAGARVVQRLEPHRAALVDLPADGPPADAVVHELVDDLRVELAPYAADAG